MSLPDDILHLIICLLPTRSRLSLCNVSRSLRTLSTPTTPRHYLMARVLGHPKQISSRPAQLRRTLRPCVAVHARVTHLLVDLDYRSTTDTRVLVKELAAMDLRLQGCMPLSILDVVSYQGRLQEVIDGLTPDMRGSIQNMRLARQYSDLVPVDLVDLDLTNFPNLISVKLMRVPIALETLALQVPNLTSLHTTEARATGWHHLSKLTKLRDLRVTSRSVLGLISMDMMLDEVVCGSLTALTSLALMGVGHASAMYMAATTVTGLVCLSLRLSCAQHLSGMWEVFQCQLALERVAVNNPALRRLELEANRLLRIPSTWTQLTSVMVLHSTPVPSLPSIAEAVVRWASSSPTYPVTLHPLPSDLLRLDVCYGALRSALDCCGLTRLIWTPHVQEFPAVQQTALLALVASQNAWTSLRSLQVLPARARGSWVLTESSVEVRRHCRYSVQLLTLLASRPTCVISHVTLFQRCSHTFGAVEALCLMTSSLEKVTLVKMGVTVAQLRQLAHMPHMRLIELIGPTLLTRHQFESVRTEVKGVRLLWRSVEVLVSGNVLDDDNEFE